MQLRADAVFEGGGVKAIAFIGAISRMEEEGYRWERLAGTSAGAMVAALLSAGYKGNELKELIESVDYKKFMDKSKVQAVPAAGKLLGIMMEKGMFRTDSIKDYIYNLLKAKGIEKFRDVYENGEFKLKIIASDITRKEMLILPEDIKRYGMNPMELEVAEAVRMSISIPIVFDPVVLKYNTQKSYIVDGGLFSNFPIWIFDVKNIPRWPSFGFLLKDDEIKYKFHRSTFAYVLDIIQASVTSTDPSYLSPRNKVRTVSIPIPGVKATDFNMIKEKSAELYKAGYNSADGFLKTWDFEDYIKRFRAHC